MAIRTKRLMSKGKDEAYSELSQAEEGLVVRGIPIVPIVKAVINKKDKETPIGVRWVSSKADGVFIQQIGESSLAAATDMRAGMRLLHINNSDFSNKTHSDVAAALRGLEGDVTIVVVEKNVICTTILKESRDTLTDIKFATATGQGIVVSSIRTGSPLSNSSLGVGNTLLMINDTDCTRLMVSEVDALLEEIPVGSAVTIFVETKIPVKTKAGSTARARSAVGDREHLPPFGVAAGGEWGTNTYCGSETTFTGALCCFFCGPIPACVICCKPFDKRPAYMVNRRVYDPDGEYLGTGYKHFKHEELTGTVDQEKKAAATAAAFAAAAAGFVGLVGTTLFIIAKMNSS